MKKIYLLLSLLGLMAQGVSAQTIIKKKLPLSDVRINRTAENFGLAMQLDTKDFRPSHEEEYLITPVLVSADGKDSVDFEPVLVSGRSLYYTHLRNNDLDGTPMYRSGKQNSIAYNETVGMQPWMDNAVLKVRSLKQGCCASVLGEYDDPIARVRRTEYQPRFNYIRPVADSVKQFELTGSAFINFPVNRTELYPEYMDNPAELQRIIGTIDSVKNDPDITITSIFIKGFASPEGPYKNNVRLAKGRTATLRQYVEDLYRFPKGFIDTAYLPENWPGLKAYVESSALANRDGILSLINSSMEADAKDNKIKSTYPKEYDFLLKNVYPRLRRSDYVISYVVRSYTTLEEILQVLHTQPQKLSEEEFYRAAQSMEAGSDEYNEVFETAVRMYPNNEACNLNAANAAMGRGDYNAAHRYLNRLDDTGEALYARGVLAALEKNYPEAKRLFQAAAKLKVADAPEAVRQIEDMEKYADGRVEIIQ